MRSGCFEEVQETHVSGVTSFGNPLFRPVRFPLANSTDSIEVQAIISKISLVLRSSPGLRTGPVLCWGEQVAEVETPNSEKSSETRSRMSRRIEQSIAGLFRYLISDNGSEEIHVSLSLGIGVSFRSSSRDVEKLKMIYPITRSVTPSTMRTKILSAKATAPTEIMVRGR